MERVKTDNALVCITGAMGSGKSVVSRCLRLDGWPVYDCDLEARRLMESDPTLRAAIEGILGPDCYGSDGCLDRRRVASLIFNSDELRMAVNSVVHAAVRRDILSWSDSNGSPLSFVETAIPVTSGITGIVDRIWLVEAPEFVRVRRVKARNGFDIDEIRRRIKAQEPEWEALEACSDIDRIVNDDSCSVICRISDLIDGLCNK